jgi:hypothetical protein
MMKRRKLGDVYLVQFDGNELGAIQHIGNDESMLSSNVVGVLKALPKNWEGMSDAEFAMLPREFYSHVFLKAGETLKIWRKAVNRSYAVPDGLAWCMCPVADYNKATSDAWRVWNTNGEMRVPRDKEDLRRCEVGIVIPPVDIVERISTGSYKLRWPIR